MAGGRLEQIMIGRQIATVMSLILLQACMYRIPRPIPPSQQKLRIIAATPTEFIVRVGEKVNLPGAGGTCSIYFLDVITIKGSKFTPRTITVTSNAREVFRIEARKLKELPLDEKGYRILKVKPR
jgi:hypothetical protein